MAAGQDTRLQKTGEKKRLPGKDRFDPAEIEERVWDPNELNRSSDAASRPRGINKPWSQGVPCVPHAQSQLPASLHKARRIRGSGPDEKLSAARMSATACACACACSGQRRGSKPKLPRRGRARESYTKTAVGL